MTMLHRLTNQGLLTDRTVLALHDTNLHPYQSAGWAYQVEGGWVHQTVERRMVNDLRNLGWDAFPLDTTPDRHGPDLPYRHGLTVMRKFRMLVV